MRSSSSPLSMRNLKVSVGTAANGGTSAPITSKFRSGMLPSSCIFYVGAFHVATSGCLPVCHRASRLRLCFDVGEECADGLPHLLAAAQAAPGEADQADKLVAGIDGNDIVFATAAYAIDEQCLDIRLHLVQDGVVVDQFLPACQLQQRFRCPRRAGIEGHDALRRAEYVDHIDGYGHALPLLVAHVEIGQGQVAVGDEQVFAACCPTLAEEQRTRLAGADHLASARFEQVAVLFWNDLVAQFAVFERPARLLPLLHELAQRSQWRGLSGSCSAARAAFSAVVMSVRCWHRSSSLYRAERVACDDLFAVFLSLARHKCHWHAAPRLARRLDHAFNLQAVQIGGGTVNGLLNGLLERYGRSLAAMTTALQPEIGDAVV